MVKKTLINSVVQIIVDADIRDAELGHTSEEDKIQNQLL